MIQFKKPYSRFTEVESEILRQHYYTMGGAQLSRFLLLGRTPMQISSRADYMGLNFNPDLLGIHLRNREDVSSLISVSTPFAAYMMGFLWADGTVNKRTFGIELKIVDSDFADIKDRWLATAKSWRYRVHSDGHPMHQAQAIVTINHHDLHQMLVQCGYLFKSGDSAEAILNVIPNHLRHYWWRGYFDGDGGFTVSNETRRVTLTSCYEQDWTFFIQLANQIGLGYALRRNQYKGSGRSSIFIDDQANLMRFMDYIYQGEQFGLSRKKQAYLDYLIYKKTVRPNKTSQYRGVCFNKEKKKWMMQIYRGRHFRKLFKTEIEAAHEYDRLALELFGNKAVLNFPFQ